MQLFLAGFLGSVGRGQRELCGTLVPWRSRDTCPSLSCAMLKSPVDIFHLGQVFEFVGSIILTKNFARIWVCSYVELKWFLVILKSHVMEQGFFCFFFKFCSDLF